MKRKTGTSTSTPVSGYLVYRRKKYVIIPENKVWINRRTPVGEEAEFWERMPYQGRRAIYPILFISNNKVQYWRCLNEDAKIDEDMANFFDKNNIEYK